MDLNYVGRTEKEAIDLGKLKILIWVRIWVGKELRLTASYHLERLNFTVEKGIVIRAKLRQKFQVFAKKAGMVFISIEQGYGEISETL